MGVPIQELEAVEDSSAEALLSAFETIAPTERRRHATVFNYWLSIRGDRPFPSVRDLDPLELSDAGPSSFLLELIGGGKDAEIRHIGLTIRDGADVDKISDVAQPSVLHCVRGRLAEVASSRSAVAFEDEFDADNGGRRCWVTLLPFSSTGGSVDYVYGFVTFPADSEPADQAEDVEVAESVEDFEAVEAEVPSEAVEPVEAVEAVEAIEAESPEVPSEAAIQPSAEANGDLRERLAEARVKADEARLARLRVESSLCEALGAAYDFAVDAEAQASEYLRLVDEQGLKIQLRSPMEPVVRMAFDGMCDDATIADLEKVMAWALRLNMPRGSLCERIEAEGGLAGAVKAAGKR